MHQAEAQRAGLKILRAFAIADAASCKEAVEVAVELKPVGLQHAAIEQQTHIAFGNEQLSPCVVTLAIRLQPQLERRFRNGI